MSGASKPASIPPFDRTWADVGGACRIGTGEIGGKAQGLLQLHELIAKLDPSEFEPIEIVVPSFAVLPTDVFDAFMDRNELRELVSSEESDERIAHAFQKSSFPSEVLGDLRALTERITWPLAVRSSSRLEDAMFRPFAGVYETKMIPNNQPDANTRFQRLLEAIKFVYASTYFRAAREYLETVGDREGDEKMAVILQDVIGSRFPERFYPTLSGVARTFNFYPTGNVPREDGVVDLALGLGKIIVDEGIAYSYVPSHPRRPPPFGSTQEFLKNSQREFWAVNMGKPPAFDPTQETEYLVRGSLSEADYDDTLAQIASTYDLESGRISPGVGRPGPRILSFAPLLQLGVLPFNGALLSIMRESRSRLGLDVELEFAMTIPRSRQTSAARLGLVQVRPMVTSDEVVDIEPSELTAPNLLLSSSHVMGNGVVDVICDVVYTRPAKFELSRTKTIAEQLMRMNTELRAARRPYLLIGFGRWGTSDPWLGIPIKWGQVSGARAIVEATLADRIIEASQGTHFFHNISSFGVSYFHVSRRETSQIQWEWLESKQPAQETEYLRHVHFDRPLLLKVDGRSGLGGIWCPQGA